MPSKILTEQLQKDIIDFYQSKPMSQQDVADKFNLCSITISKILKAHNIKFYKKAQIFNNNMNEHFFENIDNEEKAYILGLLITDGNVFVKDNKDNRQASISICLNDLEMIEKIKNLWQVNTSIVNDHRRAGAYGIAIRSNIMADDLKQYGVVPNKTLYTYLPKNIQQNLMKDLIRGIMDGDGSIQFKKSKAGKQINCISFCGTHQLMDEIAEYLFNTLNLYTKPKTYDYKDKNLSQICFQRLDDVIKIGNYLYNNATIYLTRKKQSFEQIQNVYNEKEEYNTPKSVRP